MLSELIVAGQIVEIEAVQESNDETENEENGAAEETEEKPEEGIQGMKKIYRTKVFDVLSEDQLEIMMPIEKGKVILLPLDGQFDLSFYTAKGLYQCFARVLDRYKSNNVYIVVMELTSNLRKRQRREYYRLGCAMEVGFRKLTAQEIAGLERNRFSPAKGLLLDKGTVADISGGGMRFLANSGLEVGTFICCSYTLPIKGGEKQYDLAGRILRSEEIEGKPGVFENRVQYINIDVDDREEIIKYIFEEERRQRHKVTNR